MIAIALQLDPVGVPASARPRFLPRNDVKNDDERNGDDGEIRDPVLPTGKRHNCRGTLQWRTRARESHRNGVVIAAAIISFFTEQIRRLEPYTRLIQHTHKRVNLYPQ